MLCLALLCFPDNNSGPEGVHPVLRRDAGDQGGGQQWRSGFLRSVRAAVHLCCRGEPAIWVSLFLHEPFSSRRLTFCLSSSLSCGTTQRWRRPSVPLRRSLNIWTANLRSLLQAHWNPRSWKDTFSSKTCRFPILERAMRAVLFWRYASFSWKLLFFFLILNLVFVCFFSTPGCFSGNKTRSDHRARRTEPVREDHLCQTAGEVLPAAVRRDPSGRERSAQLQRRVPAWKGLSCCLMICYGKIVATVTEVLSGCQAGWKFE